MGEGRDPDASSAPQPGSKGWGMMADGPCPLDATQDAIEEGLGGGEDHVGQPDRGVLQLVDLQLDEVECMLLVELTDVPAGRVQTYREQGIREPSPPAFGPEREVALAPVLGKLDELEAMLLMERLEALVNGHGMACLARAVSGESCRSDILPDPMQSDPVRGPRAVLQAAVRIGQHVDLVSSLGEGARHPLDVGSDVTSGKPGELAGDQADPHHRRSMGGPASRRPWRGGRPGTRLERRSVACRCTRGRGSSGGLVPRRDYHGASESSAHRPARRRRHPRLRRRSAHARLHRGRCSRTRGPRSRG